MDPLTIAGIAALVLYLRNRVRTGKPIFSGTRVVSGPHAEKRPENQPAPWTYTVPGVTGVEVISFASTSATEGQVRIGAPLSEYDTSNIAARNAYLQSLTPEQLSAALRSDLSSVGAIKDSLASLGLLK